MPTYGLGGPDAPMVTLEKRGGRWYHSAGGIVKREATGLEHLLCLSPRLWRSLAVREGWFVEHPENA